MPQPPADEPTKFDRSQPGQPSKKSSSPVVKILLALFGCGFLVFACCVGWFGYNVYRGVQLAREAQANKKAGPQGLESGEAAFKAANRQIAANTGSPARGNSEAAVNLAEKFSEDIHTLREAFFTKRKKKPLFSLSDGQFLTYCRLDDQACVFLVHVPDLRKFTKEAKADLAELAWATAQEAARSHLDSPPPRLAVGLRGIMFYDQTMVGKLQAAEEGAGDGIESRKSGTGSESLLFTFFKGDVVAEGADAEDTATSEAMSEEAGPSEPAETDSQ